MSFVYRGSTHENLIEYKLARSEKNHFVKLKEAIVQPLLFFEEDVVASVLDEDIQIGDCATLEKFMKKVNKQGTFVCSLNEMGVLSISLTEQVYGANRTDPLGKYQNDKEILLSGTNYIFKDDPDLPMAYEINKFREVDVQQNADNSFAYGVIPGNQKYVEAFEEKEIEFRASHSIYEVENIDSTKPIYIDVANANRGLLVHSPVFKLGEAEFYFRGGVVFGQKNVSITKSSVHQDIEYLEIRVESNRVNVYEVLMDKVTRNLILESNEYIVQDVAVQIDGSYLHDADLVLEIRTEAELLDRQGVLGLAFKTKNALPAGVFYVSRNFSLSVSGSNTLVVNNIDTSKPLAVSTSYVLGLKYDSATSVSGNLNGSAFTVSATPFVFTNKAANENSVFADIDVFYFYQNKSATEALSKVYNKAARNSGQDTITQTNLGTYSNGVFSNSATFANDALSSGGSTYQKKRLILKGTLANLLDSTKNTIELYSSVTGARKCPKERVGSLLFTLGGISFLGKNNVIYETFLPDGKVIRNRENHFSRVMDNSLRFSLIVWYEDQITNTKSRYPSGEEIKATLCFFENV